MEAPGVQVPDVQTLGQLEPGFKVLGVAHLDEEDVGLDAGVHVDAEVRVGGAGLEIVIGKNHLR